MALSAAWTDAKPSIADCVGSGPARSATAPAVRRRSRWTAQRASLRRMKAALTDSSAVPAAGSSSSAPSRWASSDPISAQAASRAWGRVRSARSAGDARGAPEQPIDLFDACRHAADRSIERVDRSRPQLSRRPHEQGGQLGRRRSRTAAATTDDGDDAAHRRSSRDTGRVPQEPGTGPWYRPPLRDRPALRAQASPTPSQGTGRSDANAPPSGSPTPRDQPMNLGLRRRGW